MAKDDDQPAGLDHGPIGPVYSMIEVAGFLRCSRRFLQELIKRHPHYANKGGRKLFSGEDVKALWEAMRPSQTSTVTQPKPLPNDAYERVLRRATAKKSTPRRKRT